MTNKQAYIIAWIIIILMLIGAITVIAIAVKLFLKILKAIFKPIKQPFKYQKWNDLDRIILHTKTCIRLPKSQYEPNKQYYDNFIKNPYNVTNLDNMMCDVLRHSGYTGPKPNISYTLLGNEHSKHFIRKENTPYIQITSEPKLPPKDILALIIHECMFIYAAYNKIEYSTGYNQDTVADVLAIYLGFYKNLYVAYKFYTNQKDLKYIFRKIHI